MDKLIHKIKCLFGFHVWTIHQVPVPPELNRLHCWLSCVVCYKQREINL